MKTEIHAHTRHECVYPRPDMWELPDSFTLTVRRGVDTEEDIWVATITGALASGKQFEQITFGETPAHALYMAYDVVRMLWDECDVSGPGDGAPKAKHCYCRDVIPTGAFPQPFEVADPDRMKPAKQCCRCSQVTALSAFDL